MDLFTFHIDWMAISAIATLIMALATLLTLWQSRKQLAEMKRQWDEDQKPIIEASLVINDKNPPDFQAYIQLINFGKGYANNIRVLFLLSPSEKDKLPDLFDGYINGIPMREYNMLPNSSLLIPFVDIKKNNESNEYTFFGRGITTGDVMKIEELLYEMQFPLEIVYGKKHQYKSRFELSHYLSSSFVISTIQGELNSIGQQISLLRESTKQQKDE